MKMRKNSTSRRAFGAIGVALIAAGLAFPSEARSAGARAGLDLGAWWGGFKQEGFAKSAAVDVTPAMGMQLNFGVSFDLFFVDYAPFWYWVQKWNIKAEDKTSDSSFFSPAAFRGGISLPVLPIEIYAGAGRAWYGFSTGTRNDYSGWAYRVGASLFMPNPAGKGKGGGKTHLLVEYHLHEMDADDGGTLPKGLTTRGRFFFVGLGFGVN